MRLSHRTRFILTLLGLVLGLSVLFYGIYSFMVWNWNRNQAEKYTRNAIYRAELLIDNTVTKLRAAPYVGTAGCDAPALNSIRRTAYIVGVIHEVRVRKGNRQCWAFNNPHLPLSDALKTAERFAARNPDYQIFFTSLNGIDGLGVEWKELGDTEISAVISVGHILYDVLPPEIRDNAKIDLRLTDGTKISGYPSARLFGQDLSNAPTFTASSERYPLVAELRVAPQVLWDWNRSLSAYFIVTFLSITTTVAFFITRGIVRDKGFVGELELAIARREIVPFYQPIYSLRSGEVTGFEMLARWFKPNGQIVPPDKFIPIAEETGHIDEILDLLLHTAGQELADILAERPDLKFTFNVTPYQYLSSGFVERIKQTLNSASIPLTSAVVEVTERQSLNNTDLSNAVSRELTRSGIRIAIDDAGTGHNGLSSLHSLDAQFLKIDKYFIDALFLDKKSLTIIEMLMSVANAFGMTVVAEGIEKKEQAEILSKIGVQEGQGYFFSKPVPAKGLNHILTDSENLKTA